MIKHIKQIVFVAITASLLGIGLMSVPAQASGNTSVFDEVCSTAGKLTTCTGGSSSSKSSSGTVTVNELKIRGRVVGEYIAKGGMSKKAVKASKCSWRKGGYNTIRLSTGEIVKYKDNRRQYVCKKKGGGYKVKKCDNMYYPKGGKPSRKYRTVKNPIVVKSLANYTFTGRIRGTSTTAASAKSESIAKCINSSGYGYGNSSSMTTTAYSLSFTFKGKSKARSEGTKVKQRHELSLRASLYAKVSQWATAEAKSSAACVDIKPTPVVVPKPQVTPPTVNDVVVNNLRTVTFTGKLAKGLTGFATASAGTGTIQGANRVPLNVDENGYFSVTFTYKAGSEPGTDTVTLVIDQSDGQSVTTKTKGQLPNGQVVEYFQIRAIPPESE